MKKIPLLICFAVFFAFISDKKFTAEKLLAPPGTVQLIDSLYIDKCEVSNIAWREFVNYILKVQKDPDLYIKMLPDTTVWKTQLFNNSIFIDFYFRHPDYNDFPVVGVSYEQAKVFCEWRTDRVNELLEKTPKAPYRKILYRLPTKKEWELAATGKLELEKFPYGYESTEFKSHGKVYNTFNCLYERVDSTINLRETVLPVLSSEANKYGIYNMIGNVSEMVAEKGISKGGHFNLYIDDCKILKDRKYYFPECWLGFRCVCEIVDKSPPPEKKSTKKHKGSEKTSAKE